MGNWPVVATKVDGERALLIRAVPTDQARAYVTYLSYFTEAEGHHAIKGETSHSEIDTIMSWQPPTDRIRPDRLLPISDIYAINMITAGGTSVRIRSPTKGRLLHISNEAALRGIDA